jgi:hypothetical protein
MAYLQLIQGKEKSEHRIHSVPGAMRKTVGLSYNRPDGAE